ncbi:hypothetical protein GCM10020295_81620 [Streptomyces cinereospinus]
MVTALSVVVSSPRFDAAAYVPAVRAAARATWRQPGCQDCGKALGGLEVSCGYRAGVADVSGRCCAELGGEPVGGVDECRQVDAGADARQVQQLYGVFGAYAADAGLGAAGVGTGSGEGAVECADAEAGEFGDAGDAHAAAVVDLDGEVLGAAGLRGDVLDHGGDLPWGCVAAGVREDPVVNAEGGQSVEQWLDVLGGAGGAEGSAEGGDDVAAQSGVGAVGDGLQIVQQGQGLFDAAAGVHEGEVFVGRQQEPCGVGACVDGPAQASGVGDTGFEADSGWTREPSEDLLGVGQTGYEVGVDEGGDLDGGNADVDEPLDEFDLAGGGDGASLEGQAG